MKPNNKGVSKKDTWNPKGVQLYVEEKNLDNRGHWDKTLKVEGVRYNVE
jgi:hypothetical protein